VRGRQPVAECPEIRPSSTSACGSRVSWACLPNCAGGTRQRVGYAVPAVRGQSGWPRLHLPGSGGMHMGVALIAA
jgi:hypothetical protein